MVHPEPLEQIVAALAGVVCGQCGCSAGLHFKEDFRGEEYTEATKPMRVWTCSYHKNQAGGKNKGCYWAEYSQKEFAKDAPYAIAPWDQPRE